MTIFFFIQSPFKTHSFTDWWWKRKWSYFIINFKQKFLMTSQAMLSKYLLSLFILFFLFFSCFVDMLIVFFIRHILRFSNLFFFFYKFFVLFTTSFHLNNLLFSIRQLMVLNIFLCWFHVFWRVLFWRVFLNLLFYLINTILLDFRFIICI